MRIDIWSDIACPFCYIGKRHLEAALQAEGINAEVIWHSFELDPTRRGRPETDIVTALMGKYRQSREKTEAMIAQMEAMAAASGLTFRLKDSVRINTFSAHRLLHLARDHGRQDDAKERLLAAYMCEGADLSDHETLTRLLAEVGVPADASAAVLRGDDYAAKVRADEQQARELGIRGVPFFVFNQRYAVSGAQPVQTLQQVLTRCIAEAAPSAVEAEAAACAPEGCEV